MKTIKEVSEAFEEFEEGVIARAYTISGGEENIDPDEYEFGRLERNLVEKE